MPDSINDERVIELLESIERTLGTPEGSLWSINQVGAFLSCSAQSVRRMMGEPGFPEPVRLPTGKHSTMIRFKPQDVRDWVAFWSDPDAAL